MKKLNRIKWLFAALLVVTLLNLFLLLLPDILRPKSTPESNSGDILTPLPELGSSSPQEDTDKDNIFGNGTFAAQEVSGEAQASQNPPDDDRAFENVSPAAPTPLDNTNTPPESSVSTQMPPEDEGHHETSQKNPASQDSNDNSALSPTPPASSGILVIPEPSDVAASGELDNATTSGNHDSNTASDASNSAAASGNHGSNAASDAPGSATVSGNHGSNTASDAPSSATVSGNHGNNADSTDTVTLCLMGDLMCLAGQQYTAERRDGTHDYTGSFYLLRDTFTASDFVIGNLETTLSESNPYSTAEREVNEQPNCNAPADYLASLKWAGITHLVTANNHSLDGGLIGIEETVAHLDEYGIPHTGTYRADYSGAHYLMLEKNGIRIALLAFTELINQRSLVTSSQLARIIDSYSRADAEQRIAQARADGADFVIVYEHWGSENVHEVRAYQKSHAKEIAEAGADLIIGSHPHCLQEMETIVTQDGRSVPCFYSLGNVVSSMTRDINHDTVFVQVELQRKGKENPEFFGKANNSQEPTDTVEQRFTSSKDSDASQAQTNTVKQDPTLSEDLDALQAQTSTAGTSESVSISSLTLLPCHVLTAFEGYYRVITPVDYKTDDKKAAAELAEAKARIEGIFELSD